MNITDLEQVSNVARNAAQVLAVLVGGFWGYLKFIRGRTFRSRGELSVSGQLFRFDEDEALRVQVRFKNTGLSRIRLPADRIFTVLVSSLATGAWGDGPARWTPPEPDYAASDQVPEEVVSALLPMLQRHRWVEPGETVADEQLFVASAAGDGGPVLAYRLRARMSTKQTRLHRKPLAWTSYAVVPTTWLTGTGRSPEVEESLSQQQ